MNINTKNSIVSSSGILVNGSNVSTNISIDSDLLEFYELILVAMGIDMTYDKFKSLSKEERKSLIRDIKIKTILEKGG